MMYFAWLRLKESEAYVAKMDFVECIKQETINKLLKSLKCGKWKGG